MLELPSYGQIPYSEDVRESFLLKKIKPVLIHAPNSPSSNSFRYIARKITGLDVDTNKQNIKKRKGFFSFFKNLFKKKKK